MLRFIATKVEQKDIKAGDLLSTLGPEHWDRVPSHKCNCEWKHPVTARIMIAVIAVNEEPEADIKDNDIYRITLYTDEEPPTEEEKELADLAAMRDGKDQYGSLSQE